MNKTMQLWNSKFRSILGINVSGYWPFVKSGEVVSVAELTRRHIWLEKALSDVYLQQLVSKAYGRSNRLNFNHLYVARLEEIYNEKGFKAFKNGELRLQFHQVDSDCDMFVQESRKSELKLVSQA